GGRWWFGSWGRFGGWGAGTPAALPVSIALRTLIIRQMAYVFLGRLLLDFHVRGELLPKAITVCPNVLARVLGIHVVMAIFHEMSEQVVNGVVVSGHGAVQR